MSVKSTMQILINYVLSEPSKITDVTRRDYAYGDRGDTEDWSTSHIFSEGLLSLA
jgi:hypothetical protein